MIIANLTINGIEEELTFDKTSNIKNEYDFKYYVLDRFGLVDKNIDINPVDKIFDKYFTRISKFTNKYSAIIYANNIEVEFLNTEKDNLTIGY